EADDAVAWSRRGVTLAAEIAARSPDSFRRSALGSRWVDAGDVGMARADWRAAIASYQAAIALDGSVRSPEDVAEPSLVGAEHVRLGAALRAAGDAPAALVEDRAALALLEPAAGPAPGHPQLGDALAEARLQLAALRRDGEAARGRELACVY